MAERVVFSGMRAKRISFFCFCFFGRIQGPKLHCLTRDNLRRDRSGWVYNTFGCRSIDYFRTENELREYKKTNVGHTEGRGD